MQRRQATGRMVCAPLVARGWCQDQQPSPAPPPSSSSSPSGTSINWLSNPATAPEVSPAVQVTDCTNAVTVHVGKKKFGQKFVSYHDKQGHLPPSEGYQEEIVIRLKPQNIPERWS